ncbi:MAG: porin [Elusimicrobiota bacterium]
MKKWFLVFVSFSLWMAALFSEDTFPTIKPTGFAKVRYTVDTTAGAKDSFSIAQARFGLKGDIAKEISYKFTMETTNKDTENNKSLYDAYMDIKSIPYFAVRLGQFKYKFSLENTTADEDLELINKSDVVNNFISPTRDIGIEILKSLSVKSLKSDLSVGVVNGSGSNCSDDNDNKAIIGRISLSPLKDLSFGGSMYSGATGVNTTAKDRLGFEIKYGYKNILCKAEYLHGKDGSIKKEGYYLTGGYEILPKTIFLARYDMWDSSLKVAGNNNNRWTFGLNYFLDKNVLIRNNYERKTEATAVKNDLIMTELQIRF